MDINSWHDTWGKIDWESDPEDKILQEIKDFYRAGADFNMQDNTQSRKRPLLYAAQYSTPKVLGLLIDGGADPCLTNIGGETVLHWAAHHGKTENIKYLLERGPRDFVNKRDYFNNTALHFVVEESYRDAMASHFATGASYVETAKVLIGAGANVNFKNFHYKTALHIAATIGSLEIVKMLINAGANVDIRSSENSTALHWAAWKGHTPIVKYLLEHTNIDVNAQDDNGRTALHDASEEAYPDVVNELIEHGADVNIKNHDNETALDIANTPAVIDLIKRAMKKQPQTVAKHNVKNKKLNLIKVRIYENGYKQLERNMGFY